MPVNNLDNVIQVNNWSRKKVLLIALVALIVFVLTLAILAFWNNRAIMMSARPINSINGLNKQSGVVANQLNNQIKLPVVDPLKLKQDYQSTLKQFFDTLNTKKLAAGGLDKIDSKSMQDLKDQVLQAVVPKEYQMMHLKIVLALDLIIGQKDLEKAQNDLAEAEKNINKI